MAFNAADKNGRRDVGSSSLSSSFGKAEPGAEAFWVSAGHD